jgi:NAD(P)-dependent dehydrogenase (short-subunit alcohol dehydrogenase family)
LLSSSVRRRRQATQPAVRQPRYPGQRRGFGATVTPINRYWTDDPINNAAVEAHIPMRRAGTFEDMAAVTAFLCSDEAAYITG